MSRQGLVVVGPGLMGKKHIELILANPRCDLVGIVTPDRQAPAVAANHGIPVFSDLATCLSRTAPSGVIISSPNEFHFDQARLCVERDVPVLIEKPITARYDDAERLVALIASRSAKAIVGHHRAHSPLVAAAKTVIQEGRLGRLVAIQGSAIFYKPVEYFQAGAWRREEGGGPILINLIHEIGILRTLCGEISAVQAVASNKIRKFVVEDTVAMNFQFESGVLGTFLLSDVAASSRSWEQTSRENPVYPTYADEDCYNIAGTRGSLAIPTMRLKSHPSPQSPSWWTPMAEAVIRVDRTDPLTRQLDNFLDVILGLAEPVVSAFDGLQNLKVVEAIRRSADSGGLVQVEDAPRSGRRSAPAKKAVGR